MNLKECKNAACGKDFEPKTHNQIYCEPECCRIATNERIMQRYYAERARLNGVSRACAMCELPLSRYNTTTICQGCTAKQRAAGQHYLNMIASNIT